MPKLRSGSERQNETTTLNTKLRTNNGSERQTKLNNHERQAEKDDSERHNKKGTKALNTGLKGNDERRYAPV